MRKIVITGVSSYFAKMLVPRLLSSGETEEIIGIDLREPNIPGLSGLDEERLRYVQMDVRDPKIEEVIGGSDAVVHLAFIVEEIRDKKKTHDVNIRGTKNVVHSTGRAGIPHIIVASSVAAYGAHPDNPRRIRESDRLRGNKDCYYSFDKAAVERELDVAEEKFPELIITRLRPCTIIGPNASHAFIESLKRRRGAAALGRDPEMQLLYEKDLGEAFYLALKARRPGAFNIATDDSIPQSEIFRLAGVRTAHLPLMILRPLADIAFRLGRAPSSSQWLPLVLHGIVVDNDKAKQELGWKPTFSSRETLEELLSARPRGQETG